MFIYACACMCVDVSLCVYLCVCVYVYAYASTFARACALCERACVSMCVRGRVRVRLCALTTHSASPPACI